jgi:hypothetical protein
MDGQGSGGRGAANRFMVFRHNRITGANGVNLWGLANKDVLVSQNSFVQVDRPVVLEFGLGLFIFCSRQDEVLVCTVLH